MSILNKSRGSRRKKKQKKRKITIPLKIVPVSSITPWPSSNSNSCNLQIRTTQFQLVFNCFIKSRRTFWSNRFYSLNSRVTHNSKTSIAYMKSHGDRKRSLNQIIIIISPNFILLKWYEILRRKEKRKIEGCGEVVILEVVKGYTSYAAILWNKARELKGDNVTHTRGRKRMLPLAAIWDLHHSSLISWFYYQRRSESVKPPILR